MIMLEDTTQIIRLSINSYSKNHKNFSLGKECISLDDYRKIKSQEKGKTKMNYFLLSKYRSVEENVLFTAKVLFELLEGKRKHIDQLFSEFASKQEITINLNVERILYLSLTLLYSMGKVTFNENMIEIANDEVHT